MIHAQTPSTPMRTNSEFQEAWALPLQPRQGAVPLYPLKQLRSNEARGGIGRAMLRRGTRPCALKRRPSPGHRTVCPYGVARPLLRGAGCKGYAQELARMFPVAECCEATGKTML